MSNTYKICLELIDQRGYELIEQQKDKILARKPDGDMFCALLIDIIKFDVSTLKECTSIMCELRAYHALIVYKQTATHAAQKAASKLSAHVEPITDKGKLVLRDEGEHIQKCLRMELFAEEDLQYNITKSLLQPLSFEKLSDTDLIQINDTEYITLNKFKKIWSKIPIMRTTDPIALFYDYSKGDIIRVKRRNGIINYRVVR